jgi:signal transduction histidine kinase
MAFSNISIILYSANCIVTILLIIFVLRRNGFSDNKEILFHLLILLIALGSLGFLQILNLSSLTETLSGRISLYGTYLLALSFLFVTFWFTRNTASHLVWIIFGLLWSVGVLVLNENHFAIIDPLYSNGSFIVSRIIVARASLIVGWGIFNFASILYMVITYRKTVYPLHKNRYKYWFMALLVYIGGSTFVIYNQVLPGLTLLLLGSALVTFSGLTHQLPDIRQILKKSAAYIIVSLISIVIYTLVIFLTSLLNVHASISSIILAALITGAGLVIIANPAINLFQRWIQNIVAGKSININRLLGEYGKNISNILDLNTLAEEIVDHITEGLEIQYGELFLISPKDDILILQLVNKTSAGNSSTQRLFTLDKGGVISNWFTEIKKPLTQYDLDFHPQLAGADKAEKDLLSRFRMDIFVPILAQDDWIGLLALGPKKNGDRIFDEEVAVLSTLADQTSVGLRNARLYEDLKNQNAENVRLNKDLSAANEELARLDQAKSDFISIASHEIRTPLTQIIGYNDILTDMIKGGNVQRTAGLQMVDGVHKASRRLEDIVDTMFDVSKLDTRTLDLHYTDINLSSVIANAVDKWNLAFEDRRQTFIVRGVSSLPTIQGDNRRLTQVFSNIIQNAIKYTPDGGEIRVTGQLMQQTALEDTSYIELTITDTGIGIEPDDLNRIFEKFYRVGNVMLHSSGETKFKGAGPGLGLTIAKGIVEAHGGKIWAESPGNDETNCPGSEFHIILPVNQVQK